MSSYGRHECVTETQRDEILAKNKKLVDCQKKQRHDISSQIGDVRQAKRLGMPLAEYKKYMGVN